MKFRIKTENLTGDNLQFVTRLNEMFAEMPEAPSPEELNTRMTAAVKADIEARGLGSVDWAKLTTLNLDAIRTLVEDKPEHEANLNTLTGIRAALKKQGEIINGLKELGTEKPSQVKNVRTMLKEYMEANKEQLAAFKTGNTRSFGTTKDGEPGIELETRAAVTMTVGGSSNGSAFIPGVEILPGVIDIARTKPFIEQYANTGSTNRPRIVWAEKTNKQGQAAFIAEGGVKPLISFEWRTSESYAKKVADKIKVSTEALDDVDFLAAEIEYELKWEVDIRVDVELLTGAGDGTNGATTLKGLVSYIGGYVLTTIKTTTPNNFDVLRAAYGQIQSLFFAPNYVFINPIDGANMDLAKDTQGRPLMMQYRDAAGRLFRLTPIETTQIPVGYFLMGDMTRFRIRNYKPFAIYYGWVNDDFEKNLVTVIGERRLHSFVAQNELGAFVYDTFANVKTAITAP